MKLVQAGINKVKICDFARFHIMNNFILYTRHKITPPFPKSGIFSRGEKCAELRREVSYFLVSRVFLTKFALFSGFVFLWGQYDED